MTQIDDRPQIVITAIDSGPRDLAAQLPVHAQLIRIIPGPDRPDYSLAIVDEPITFRTTVAELHAAGTNADAAQMITINPDGTAEVTVFGLVLASRIAGSSIHLSMEDFPVMIAYIVDNTQMEDAIVDFSKCFYAAIGLVRMDGTTPPTA